MDQDFLGVRLVKENARGVGEGRPGTYSGIVEFQWFATESPPPLLAFLKIKYQADEAFDATWADQPMRRYKVLAVSEDFTSDSGVLTAKAELVAEAIK